MEQDKGYEDMLGKLDFDNSIGATTDSESLARQASMHNTRYRHLGLLEDLEKALEYQTRAFELTPDGHPKMVDRLANLAEYYDDRYRRLGRLEDIEKSLEYDTRALALTPDGHPDMPVRLANLALSYEGRYRRHGQVEDLDKSLEYKNRALALTPDGHPDMPDRLASLAVSYEDRYRRHGQVEDLDKSLEYRNRALALTPDGHPDMPDRLASLAASYTYRYRRHGQVEDLDKSLEYKNRALALTPDGHPDMPVRLASLAVSYEDRYKRHGQVDDLDKSLEYKNRALALTPDGHPDMPVRLTSLAVSYADRYERHGQVDDLDKSLEYKNRALALTPDGHPDMPVRLTSLAVSYADRYERHGQVEDLDKSLEYNNRALALTPDGHRDMPVRLANLAVSYDARYRLLGKLEDFEKSLELDSRSLALTPEDHPGIPHQLANLAMSYDDRFKRLGQIKDLETSLEYRTRALALTPHSHPQLSWRHRDLAISHLDHFRFDANASHLESSLHFFRAAALLLTSSPRDRFHHALEWAKSSSEHINLNPIEAYKVTMGLLPQFIWLGATTTQRYHDLSTAEHLAVNAACVAILSAQCMLAVEWLEHARCVVWNQSLMLRSPLDRLHSFHPELATRIQSVANRLQDVNAQTGMQSSEASSADSMAAEQAGQERRRLAGEYQNLLAEARRMPGFEDFLQPMKAERLIAAARHGPIAVINCHEHRCDALIVRPGQHQIDHLPLPTFTKAITESVRSQMESSLRQRLRERGVRPMQEPGHKYRFENVLAVLWDNIVKPVLEFLGYINDEPTEILPHITWCPTGALSFLPLHAAGDYSQPRSRVFDYVISSYTPTLTALLSSAPSKLSGSCSVLGIGQANTPGHNRLPGTVDELANLGFRINGKATYTQLMDSQATTAAVLDAMEQHEWVHLACHAHQNVKDPTKSGFYLHDGTLDLAAINRRSFKNKGLAFLSACQTATGDEKLPDEAIHLASGMLMAGYPSVIATMWSVVDQDAPLVADKVYEQLMRDGKIGNGEAGRALHYAVAALRAKVGDKSFGRWVPYIHIGS